MKILEKVRYAGGILLLGILLYRFVFFVVLVPSPSMYPTLEPGDRIVTTRLWREASIRRGEILVFYSEEYGELMVKRVVGLPGDHVEIKATGEVFVDGRKLYEPYVEYPDAEGGDFTVPSGTYFFLGDYRIHSADSRKWVNPFIPGEQIQGKARLIIFPWRRLRGLPLMSEEMPFFSSERVVVQRMVKFLRQDEDRRNEEESSP